MCNDTSHKISTETIYTRILKFKSNQHTSKEAIKTLKTLLQSGMYKLMSTFGTNKEANTAGSKFELY